MGNIGGGGVLMTCTGARPLSATIRPEGSRTWFRVEGVGLRVERVGFWVDNVGFRDESLR